MKSSILLTIALAAASVAHAQPADNKASATVKTEQTPANDQAVKTRTEPVEPAFVSPYVENGLPLDAMRSMLLEPELAGKMKSNQQMWIGNILRLGLYTRPRAEFRDNLNFSQSNTEKISRFSQNSQIFFFINPTRDAEVKVTLQDARVWGGDGGARAGDDRAAFFSNGDNTNAARSSVDIREAYVQFRNVGLRGAGLQVGRQVLAYGDQRMIGGANWTIGGLSYDGIVLKYDGDLLSSHWFGVKATSSPTNNVPNGGASNTTNAQGDSYLTGWYNSVKMGFAVLDLYALGMFRSTGLDSVCLTGTAACSSPDIVVTSATNTQRSQVYTFGARLTNRTDTNKLPVGSRWDYTLEAAFQAGKASDLTFTDSVGNVTTTSRIYDGQLFFAQTGYKVLDDLRLGAQAFYTPGTANRTGSSIDTFQTMPGPRFGGFPYLNTFNGISENMGMKNLFSPSVSLTYQNKKWGDLIVSYFYEMKATSQDAWYGISGLANSATSPTAGRISTETASNSGSASLGTGLYQELDFIWMQRFSNYFSLWIGAGYLHAGDAIGIARGSDFKADGFMTFIQLQGAL